MIPFSSRENGKSQERRDLFLLLQPSKKVPFFPLRVARHDICGLLCSSWPEEDGRDGRTDGRKKVLSGLSVMSGGGEEERILPLFFTAVDEDCRRWHDDWAKKEEERVCLSEGMKDIP